jgi:hypothetical protein
VKTLLMLTLAAVVAVLGITAAHASVTAPPAHHIARTEVVRWTDYRHCPYKVTLSRAGGNGISVYVNTDTCHHRMWAVARCYDGKNLYGNVVTNPGHHSTTAGTCGAGNIGGLHWWGLRDQQFVSANHLVTRMHCLSSTSCNT